MGRTASRRINKKTDRSGHEAARTPLPETPKKLRARRRGRPRANDVNEGCIHTPQPSTRYERKPIVDSPHNLFNIPSTPSPVRGEIACPSSATPGSLLKRLIDSRVEVASASAVDRPEGSDNEPSSPSETATTSEVDVVDNAGVDAGLLVDVVLESSACSRRYDSSLSPASRAAPSWCVGERSPSADSVPEVSDSSVCEADTSAEEVDELQASPATIRIKQEVEELPAGQAGQVAVKRPAPIKGFHVSSDGGLGRFAERCQSMFSQVPGEVAVQFFCGSPGTNPKQVVSGLLDEFRGKMQGTALNHWTMHSNHVTNLAASAREQQKIAFAGIKQEMENCRELGVRILCIHLGTFQNKVKAKAKGKARYEADVNAAVARVVKSLKRLLKAVPDVCLALENMVHDSQTTCEEKNNWDLKLIKRVIDGVNDPRIKACVDICHAYIRDYDLRTEEGLEAMLADMAAIGWGKIAGLHVSDSQTEHGGRCEGHEDSRPAGAPLAVEEVLTPSIGHGYIPLMAFRRIVAHPELMGKVPCFLETPYHTPAPRPRDHAGKHAHELSLKVIQWDMLAKILRIPDERASESAAAAILSDAQDAGKQHRQAISNITASLSQPVQEAVRRHHAHKKANRSRMASWKKQNPDSILGESPSDVVAVFGKAQRALRQASPKAASSASAAKAAGGRKRKAASVESGSESAGSASTASATSQKTKRVKRSNKQAERESSASWGNPTHAKRRRHSSLPAACLDSDSDSTPPPRDNHRVDNNYNGRGYKPRGLGRTQSAPNLSLSGPGSH